MYGWTSCEQQPKMSSLDGCLQEVVAYESLDCIGSKFCLSDIMVTAETMFYSSEKAISWKNPYFPLRSLRFLY